MMIKIKNLSYTYQPHLPPALLDINLSIGRGEYIALIGANGSGKSTLIRHLNALLLPSRGEIEIDGLNTKESKDHIEIRRKVGMVFQNPDHQIVGMSVEEDVAFGPGNLNLPSTQIRQRVNKALEMVGLKGSEKRSPYTLSGGEKQLLALAGLLAMDPQYIILDEATSSLDPVSKEKVLNILEQLKDTGISIIHVTHNMEEALRAHRVLLMDQGQIIADGPAGDILNQGEKLKALGLSPPIIVELMCRMQPYYDRQKCILSVDQAAVEIRSWLKTIK
jgi:energy-coupling factor transporter ATPase